MAAKEAGIASGHVVRRRGVLLLNRTRLSTIHKGKVKEFAWAL